MNRTAFTSRPGAHQARSPHAVAAIWILAVACRCPGAPQASRATSRPTALAASGAGPVSPQQFEFARWDRSDRTRFSQATRDGRSVVVIDGSPAGIPWPHDLSRLIVYRMTGGARLIEDDHRLSLWEGSARRWTPLGRCSMIPVLDRG